MALIDREATNPDFSTPYASIGQMLANQVRDTINTKLSTQTSQQNLAMALLEVLTNFVGNGAIYGGEISAGAGLSVEIAAYEAFVGSVIGDDAATTVGGLVANDVNYLFLRQNGTWTVNQDGSDPSAAAGDFLLWGTATTDGSSVTAISNVRDTFRLTKPLIQQRHTVRAGEQCHIGQGFQSRLFGGLTIAGSLKIDGRLRIEP